jgi:peptidoglycan/xylan/chitin deacetylase (PgdA/CDA1 family)
MSPEHSSLSEEARRARIIAGSALGAVVLLVLVILLTTGGGDSGRRAQLERSAAATKPKAKPKPKKAPVAAKPAAFVADLGPNPLRGAEAQQAQVPILMFHVIAAPPANVSDAELWTPPETFKADMQALADSGYRAITMRQLFDAWDKGAAIPRQPVVVSFDDGYLSHAQTAAPILKEHGWPGVVNLTLENLGGDGLPIHLLKPMIATGGWEVDSHTVTHPDLTTLSPDELQSELVDSKAQIKAKLGQPAAFFCYPAGKFNDTVVAAVKAAGYEGATTEVAGLAKSDERYQLRRIRVQGTEDPGALLAQMQSYAGAASQ